MDEGLKQWPRGARGREPVFPWVPSSSQAAISSLMAGLTEELRTELLPRLIRVIPGQLVSRRAELLRELAERCTCLLTELTRLGAATWDIPSEKPLGRLERAAEAHLRLALFALGGAVVEAQGSTDRLTKGRSSAQREVALTRAVADLPWVNGSMLSLAAIGIEFEGPIPFETEEDRALAGDRWEKIRQHWDKRLQRAREKARHMACP